MKYIITVLCLVLLAGCSSTSTGNLSGIAITNGTQVSIQENLNEQEKLFMPDLVRVLEKRGFVVTKDSNSNYAVQITYNSDSVFNVYCNIVLMKDGVPLISANGTNPGWGTVIFRGSARKGVFDSALEQFEKKLYEH